MSSPTPATPSQSRPEQAERSPDCGILASHRVIRFTGPDAATFLQGYLTCDTDKLSAQRATPGAFTNLKGRVVANGWVWGTNSDILMLISADLTETVGDFLKMYLNFAKTTLSLAPHAPAVCLQSATRPAEDNPDSNNPVTVQLSEGAALLNPGFSDEQSVTSEQHDLSAAWLAHAIAMREVLTTQPTSGSLLPQMLGLIDLGAVSFDKGCYLGQEVVARAQHRGEVKRRLQHIEYSAEQPLPAGATLEDQNGKRIAVVINATGDSTSTAGTDATDAALIVTAADDLKGQLWSYADTPVQLA